LDRAEVLALEPHVMSPVKGAVHWTGTQTLTDPGALLQAYAKYFVADGGTIAAGSAESLRADGPGWSVSLAEGVTRFAAPTVVVAAGAWSMALVKPYGIHVPLGIKRGYHQHYQPKGNAVLSRPIADEDGYVMAPMSAGIRLTTGAELAHPDAPPSYDQLRQTEHLAQQIFPLGEPVPEEPWMGLRPCSPDMLPLIGPIPKHDGLFAAFGHGHQGMTLGPITGQLMAELIIDGKTSVDITPFLPARYSR
jgi:D-amino-acid dehydrogenase